MCKGGTGVFQEPTFAKPLIILRNAMMPPERLNIGFAFGGFTILLLMTVDLFMLSNTEIYDVVSDGTIEDVRPYNSHSYGIYYLVGESKEKYKVHEYLYNIILIGNPIVIYETRLFKRRIAISWCDKDENCFTAKIHPLNSYTVNVGLIMVCLTLNACIFIGIIKVRTSKASINNVFLQAICIGILVYYLIN